MLFQLELFHITVHQKKQNVLITNQTKYILRWHTGKLHKLLVNKCIKTGHQCIKPGHQVYKNWSSVYKNW